MAYDEQVAHRIRQALPQGPHITEKRMFGGIAFLLNGNMFCGVIGDQFVARIGPSEAEAAMRRPHVKPMDFTGRPLKAYVYISPDGVRTRPALQKWLRLALKFAATLASKRA
jgi:TfoX/Sxy family transcriptional regulator of competence genes